MSDVRSVLAEPGLPELPHSWSAAQLRRILTLRNGQDYKEVEVKEGGYPVYGSGGEFRRSSEFLYDGPSVLFGRKGTVDKPLLVDGRFWTVDTMFFTALSPLIEPRFLHYYATTMPFDYYRTNTAVPSMTQTDLAGHSIPLPPLEVQRAIADYLDRETAQIDTLIVKQEQLIATLRERRETVVARLVWGGVGSLADAPLTGNPWLTAPAHWARLRNKQILEERVSLSGEGNEELLSVSHITGISPRTEKNVTMFEAESLAGYRHVAVGDLVINTMWAWMGALGFSSYSGIVSPAYGVYRTRPGVSIDPRYFDALVRTREYIGLMTAYSRGMWSSRLRLYPDVFLSLPNVLPPLREQVGISDVIDEQTGKIDNLMAKADQFIEVSKERRSALITAAVTGAIAVPAS